MMLKYLYSIVQKTGFFIFLSFFIFLKTAVSQEKLVAISMDDMPFLELSVKVDLQQVKQINDSILAQITRFNTPLAALVCGKDCISANQQVIRISILKSWAENPLVTIANHSFSHKNAADIDLDAFKVEVMRNDSLLKSISNNRTIKYFRFPFNSLGKDSIGQIERATFLKSKGYTVVPFTIQTEDYAYGDIYINEINNKNFVRADSIAKIYVQHTLAQFDFFEKVSNELYGSSIKQIYLIHANKLNADCYSIIIKELQKRGYKFISLDDAMTDKVYSQPIFMYNKYGYSWFYRWIKDKKQKIAYNKQEPVFGDRLLDEYHTILKSKK